MPELAEVEYFRKQWDVGRGEKIVRVSLHREKRIFRGQDTRRLTRALTGAVLTGSEARGKQLLFTFSGNAWLGVHLGMTGKLLVEGPGFEPGKHDHLVLYQTKRALIYNDMRLFGRILFHHGPEQPDWWAKIPAALTDDGFTAEALAKILAARSKSPLKSLLLLQNYFPGIGNWMADEILFQAGVHPETSAGRFRAGSKSLTRLWESIRFVCRESLEKVGQDFSDPPASWLFHERWKRGGFCPRHHLLLSRKVVGGRTTVFCLKCQPRPKVRAAEGRGKQVARPERRRG